MSGPLTTAARLTAVPFGATVEDVNEHGEVCPWFVMHRCDARAFGYYCMTHRQFMANVGNLALHCDDTQPHEIVNWCQRHSVYEEADPVQLAALDGQS